MTLPALLVLGVVIGYPIVRAIMASFYHSPLLSSASTFAGVDNYQRLAQDPVFFESLKNTGIYTAASVIGGMIFGLILALATERLEGPWRFFRAILLTPWAVPVIVVAFLFRFMFEDNGGITNVLLLKTGIIHTAIPWLSSSQWALIAVIIANIWSQAPFFLLIFTAALGGVPIAVTEAARIDRASTWAMITKNKLPNLSSAALVGALLMVIQNFNNFPLIWAMTQGGPAYSSTTLVIYVYRLAFTSFKLGYASAVGVVWLVLLLIIASAFIRVLRGKPS